MNDTKKRNRTVHTLNQRWMVRIAQFGLAAILLALLFAPATSTSTQAAAGIPTFYPLTWDVYDNGIKQMSCATVILTDNSMYYPPTASYAKLTCYNQRPYWLSSWQNQQLERPWLYHTIDVVGIDQNGNSVVIFRLENASLIKFDISLTDYGYTVTAKIGCDHIKVKYLI